MLVPLSWLQEYVDISGISVDNLQKKMSAAGLSVERKHTVGEGISEIVIGEIVSQEKHPDSDHLWVCRVQLSKDKGQEAENTVQIVTGAQNIYLHGKVPVVLPGMTLPDGSKIEATKLRGLDSYGMMCSEKELGLGDNHEGIMMLGEDAPVGQKLAVYLNLPDVVFDIEITANRGDCLSVVGIAREVATLLSKDLFLPETQAMENVLESPYNVSVRIDDPVKCPRFAAVVFDGLQREQVPG
jgi:phenylalanyl-tRNA synthetase beta chain